MKRSTPERMYLLAEWGSKLPYRRAAELLNEMLAEVAAQDHARWPLAEPHSASTLAARGPEVEIC